MRRRFWFVALLTTLLLGLGGLTPAAQAATVDVVDVRYGMYYKYDRVVIETTGATTYKTFTLTGPDRLVIDVENAVLKTSTDTITLYKDETVSQIRRSQFSTNPYVTRVVIDLRGATTYSHFTLSSPFRIVVDVNRRQVLSGWKVCVDPGHGGSDPGAIGPTGLKEADVNLDVGSRVTEWLKGVGASVTQTRTSDVYVSLSDRVATCNNAGVHRLESVHHNASSDSTVNGTETYYRSTSTASQDMAGKIQSELLNALGLRDRGTKNGDHLYMIKNPNAPPALSEASFISNPDEEARLKTSSYRAAEARAIYIGLRWHISGF